MTRLHSSALFVLGLIILLGGCATRPINPAITQADPTTGYRFVTHAQKFKDRQNLVILAFSGGGTRAAAFSYGVLEALRPMVLTGPKGNSIEVPLVCEPSGR